MVWHSVERLAVVYQKTTHVIIVLDSLCDVTLLVRQGSCSAPCRSEGKLVAQHLIWQRVVEQFPDKQLLKDSGQNRGH